MKKILCMLLAACLLLALAACGAEPEAPAAAPAETESAEWTRAGYFTDESENLISVTWMEDIDEPGWYVGAMIGDFMGGCTLPQVGDTLHGDLNAWLQDAEPFVVTISEEGEDGLLLAVEGGESYHFKPYEMPKATVVVTINTEGRGNIAWAAGEEAPEIDRDYPYQSAYIGLAEPAVHTFVAWAPAGSFFVKWTKNGEDFSTEPQITLLLDESAEYIAVFEEDLDWQNPVMNFIGDYQCDRASARVDCFGFDEAWITVKWGSSAWELTQWDIVGRLDTDTLTIAYTGCTERNLVYDDRGELKSEEVVYEDGTGTIVFHDDGSFTWHEDQSVSGWDMLFERLPTAAGDGVGTQLANPWREITQAEAKQLCPQSFAVPEGAENARWSVMEAGEEPLVQLSFDLYGLGFTAREQHTGDAQADISGMYYDWTYQTDETLRNWGGLPCRTYRWIDEGGYADLCAWFDAESGVSYTVSVTAADLDGFDLLAVAEMLHG